MPRSRLVTTDDWPEAELRAGVLAGELVAVGHCWASPAEPQDPALRAAAAGWVLRDQRLVAAGQTAAWIWGAVSRPPDPLEASVPPHLRLNVGPEVRLREVVLPASDVTTLGTVAVTTPARTAVDLLRTPGALGDERTEAVAGLLTLGVVTAPELGARLSALGTIPMVRQAERRLRELLSRR
ncbi:type IV toxin-antitoxin system AbiEi family antitoxin [Curtobacterium sp. PhB115]|uniref:type IV toxin-antitoxin system AbiEi family antitoxin n=1 Tax=Curtobacterium sp. PhB115 TaxID=2485173 RepID=UPI000F4C3E44|nr:type IV toxin-antitoxin system AbiEi family antitoxin [Curtobacterium sp. PhB115]ROP66833.1 transcriptional regulator with AbiEi antitoxin domain of type IV toxin-antitoxin system [Curtobacterium sp. PhB115]